ncbi:MAG: GIY-YIG nuclease family protein [Bryobacteraceae bacterium]
MDSNASKKEAIRKFKEQKIPRGIFGVRCTPSGEVWVGFSRNLDASRNSVFFELRLKGHLNKGLQEVWNQHGEDAFTFEVLETLPDDIAPMLLADELKSRRKHWVAELNGKPL